MYGHIRSVSAILYVHIRLLREFVLAPQHSSLPMDLVYPYLYGEYIWTVSESYVRKMRDRF